MWYACVLRLIHVQKLLQMAQSHWVRAIQICWQAKSLMCVYDQKVSVEVSHPPPTAHILISKSSESTASSSVLHARNLSNKNTSPRTDKRRSVCATPSLGTRLPPPPQTLGLRPAHYAAASASISAFSRSTCVNSTIVLIGSGARMTSNFLCGSAMPVAAR